MAAGMVGVVRVCQGVRLQGCKVGRLQGCKFNDIQSVSLHLFCCGLLLGCMGVFVPLRGCTVPGMVEAVRVGGLVVVGWWCGGAGGGGGWQGYTPLFICIVGTIRGFGMRKFFFEFWGRLAWCGAECGGEGVEG